MQVSTDFSTIVVGAGVVGLAIARQLARAGDNVVVLERHSAIGSETSSRNSEVIHAGIYYPPDSLKARFCREGRNLLYKFAEDYSVAHKRLGKLIVATEASQLEALRRLQVQAHLNGVEDLQWLSKEVARSLEPEVVCEGALFSPSTGIISAHELMLAIEGDAGAHGAHIVLKSRVTGLCVYRSGVFAADVRDEAGSVSTIASRRMILANAHDAPALMATADLPGYSPPRMYMAKGNYFSLGVRSPFSHLIYPLPGSAGLGIHATLDMAGRVRFGPDVEWVESMDYSVNSERCKAFERAIRCYWPGLPSGALSPDYAGIRPKVAGPGEPAADFVIHTSKDHGQPGLIALYGIESPGLTASLAIAKYVATELSADCN